jgi:hypothetical protein
MKKIIITILTVAIVMVGTYFTGGLIKSIILNSGATMVTFGDIFAAYFLGFMLSLIIGLLFYVKFSD